MSSLQRDTVSHVPSVLITGLALPTVIPRPKAGRGERCDWCGSTFDHEGTCKRCQRPA